MGVTNIASSPPPLRALGPGVGRIGTLNVYVFAFVSAFPYKIRSFTF